MSRPTPLGEVYDVLNPNAIESIAVLHGETLVGVCSRTRLDVLLGQHYGYVLFAKTPAGDHLSTDYLKVTTDTPTTEVLTRVFSRSEDQFYDDVVLVDPHGGFLGFIEMQTLIILQNRFFMQSITQLENQQAEFNRKNRQMENDLLLARQVQLALLPQEFPTFPPGVDPSQNRIRFYHHYQSADL